MTIQLSPARQHVVTGRLQAVVDLAETARTAADLDAAKRALNAAWFAIHEAQDAINEADRQTREEALAKLRSYA